MVVLVNGLHPWLRRGLRVALGAVAILLALEGFCRIVVPESARTIAVDRAARVYGAQHDREHPHSEGRSNVLDVIVVGDSLAFGPGNHRCDRFSNRLEWLMNLNDGVRPACVETKASPSALYQQSKALDWALEQHPDLVIFAVHVNDTEDWENPAAMVELRSRLTRRPEHTWLRPAMQRSVLVRQIVRAVDTRRAARGAASYYRHLYAPDYPGLARFRNAAADFSARCQAHGVPMVAVLFPLTDVNLQPGGYPCEAFHGLIKDAFSTNGVPFLDLLPVFRRFPACRDCNIESVDDHLSEIGHRIAADAIFEFLLERRLIDPVYKPRNLKDPTFNSRMVRKVQAMGYDVPPGF